MKELFLQRNRFFYTASVLLLGGMLLFQLILERGGESHVESNCFLILYNFTPDLLKTIFDPLRTDWNLYQSRELSYLVDSFDARFIGWSIRHEMAHFYSLSAIAAAVLTLVVQQLGFAYGFPRMNCWLGVFLSAMWQFVPCNFLHQFFRCGKPVTALLITLLLFSLRVLWVNEDKRVRLTAKICAVSAIFLLPCFDRQGLFLLASTTVFTALAGVFCQEENRKKLLLKTSLYGVGSIAVSTVMNVLITPAIVKYLNGYTPSFEYQQMSALAVFDFRGTIYFLFDNIGFWLFGFDNGGVLVLVAFGWMIWLLWRKKSYEALALLVCTIGVLSAMANLMMARHNLLILDGVSHTVYFMPFAAVLIFLMAVMSEYLNWKHTIPILCAAVLVSQSVSTVFDNSDPVHNRFHRHATERIIETLNNKELPSRQQLMPYSAWKLIDAFRGQLTGWEFGPIPIKYPSVPKHNRL